MPGPVRRLAAVMLTDIVGYSSSTQRDEARTLKLLSEHRRVVRPVVAARHGREVKTIGDAFLIEFDSATEAVECGIEIQRAFFERNRELPEDRVDLRVGIHTGDVVHEDDDVYGDAVNMVSRIEPLAEPGGICVSGQVYEQVRGTLRATFQPVEVSSGRLEALPTAYRVVLPWLTRLRPGAAPLIGREAELGVLRRLVESTARSDGRVLLITGAAGIGKSRFVQETGRFAAEAGGRVLVSRSLPGELSGPYSPWVEVAREFIRNAPPQTVDRVCGTFGSEVARLVPELSDRVGPDRRPPASDIDEARLRLFDAVTQFFQNISRESPLVLVIEDLQWADGASLSFFRYIARKLRGYRLAIIGTYREQEVDESPMLVELLADLNRERLAEVVDLKPLGPDEVQKMVAHLAGPEVVSPEAASLIFERTGGNPFFVEEVLQTLSEDGLLSTGTPSAPAHRLREVRLPDTVRRVVQRRLARLDAPTTDLLRVASILGYDFSHATLRTVAGLDDEALSARLESATGLRVIEECRGPPSDITYSFADRILRDILYEEQSAVRRRRYHLRAARALEALPERERRAVAHELSHHYLEANELDAALKWTLVAAGQARLVFARDEVIRLCRTALDLLESRPDDRLRASTLLELSENERFTAEMELSLRHALEAATLYERLGDARGAARAHVEAGSLYQGAYYDDPHAIDQFEKARRALEGLPPSRELGDVLLSLAEFTKQGLPSRDSRRMIAQALELGQKLPDTGLEIDARMALLWSTPPEEADSVVGQLASLEPLVLSEAPDPRSLRSYYTSRGWAALLLDEDPAAGLRWFQRGIDHLRRVGAQADAVDMEGQHLAQAHLTLGEIGVARRLAEDAYEYAIRNYPNPDIANLTVLAEIARLDGQLDRSAELLDTAFAISGRSVSVLMRLAPAATLTRLRMDQGRWAEALKVAREALSPMLEREILAPAIALSDYAELLAMAAEAAVSGGTQRRLGHFVKELHRIVEIAPRRPIRGFLLYADGLWTAREEGTRRAAPMLEESVEVWTSLGWKPFVARTLGTLARVLQDGGDRDGARAARERSAEVSQLMGVRSGGANAGRPESRRTDQSGYVGSGGS